MKRDLESLRMVIDKVVALTGVTLVLVQVLHLAETRLQGSVIVVGMLLAVAGAWRLAGHDHADSETGATGPLRARSG